MANVKLAIVAHTPRATLRLDDAGASVGLKVIDLGSFKSVVVGAGDMVG